MYGTAVGSEGLGWEGGESEGLNVKRRWPTLEAGFEKTKVKVRLLGKPLKRKWETEERTGTHLNFNLTVISRIQQIPIIVGTGIFIFSLERQTALVEIGDDGSIQAGKGFYGAGFTWFILYCKQAVREMYSILREREKRKREMENGTYPSKWLVGG